MKKPLTFIILIFLNANLCFTQSNVDDSMVNELMVSHPIQFQILEVNEFYLDTIIMNDSASRKVMYQEFLDLTKKIAFSTFTFYTNLINQDTLNKYELIFIMDYTIDESSWEHAFQKSSLIKRTNSNLPVTELEWSLETSYLERNIWRSEKLLIINFNHFYIGQFFNRNSGKTYYLKRK